MGDLTRLQNTSAWMARGCVAVLVNTETLQCHTSGRGALYPIEQAETGGSSPHSPPMQVSSAVLWKTTEAKKTQTCQLTTQAMSEQDAAVTAQTSHPLAQHSYSPGRKHSALLSSIAVFLSHLSPGLYHLLFPLLNPGAGEPTSLQSVI